MAELRVAPRRRAPAEADLAYAGLFYYTDDAGSQQGPFAPAHMRAWMEAGYLLPQTKCAPSYYGEVPGEMWPISELWEHPADRAFVPASDAVTSTAVETPSPDFVEAAHFSGELHGYIFKMDDYGLGYYRDQPAPPRVTTQSIREEQRTKRLKAAAIQSLGSLPKFDSISSS